MTTLDEPPTPTLANGGPAVGVPHPLDAPELAPDAPETAAADDRRERVCVVGAGTSGMAAAHRLLEAGFRVDVFESTDGVGGVWNYGSPSSRVFRTTHLVSSKRLTQYPDFPMPASYPAFPHHSQVLTYLRGYAERFGLREHIRFGTTVASVRPVADRTWLVALEGGESAVYGAVVVANGHNWVPRLVEYPGTFDGRIMHASEYTTSEVLRGQRVVVVGGGNSGCDIACEAAQVADHTVHSLRRGYHVMPKFIAGLPSDVFQEIFLRLGVPVVLRRAVGKILLRVYSHELWRYGYARPDHKLWETHLVLNSQLVHHAAHGDILPKPDIARFEGSRVHFTDGTSVEADLVVLATGFRTVFPFLRDDVLEVEDGRSPWHLNLFHRRREGLSVLGLMQPTQGQWQLVDAQARLVAAYLAARTLKPDAARRFRARVADPPPHLGGPFTFVSSPRHVIEVEHISYRRLLRRALAALGGDRPVAAPPAGASPPAQMSWQPDLSVAAASSRPTLTR